MSRASLKGVILIEPPQGLRFMQVLKSGKTLLMEQRVMYGP